MLGSGVLVSGVGTGGPFVASTIVAGEPGHQFLWVLGVNILKEPCGGHASKRRGRATAVADVHLVPAYGVVETLCAGHKNEPGRAFASVGVACQRDGTTVLPRAWDHLEVLSSMTVLVSGVNGDAPTLPVGGAFDDEGVRP